MSMSQLAANTASRATGKLLTVGTGGLQHVGDKSGADRSARLVLLVLASIGEVGTEMVSSVCPVQGKKHSGIFCAYTLGLLLKPNGWRKECA
jgi:hypothetical protein